MNRVLWPTVALGFALLSTAPASAQISAPASTTVSIRGLDISTDAGARELLKRIHIAAASVCFEDDPIYAQTNYIPCIASATTAAVARLGNPIVIALNDHGPQKAMVVANARQYGERPSTHGLRVLRTGAADFVLGEQISRSGKA